MRTKTLVAIILILVLCLSLVGCAKEVPASQVAAADTARKPEVIFAVPLSASKQSSEADYEFVFNSNLFALGSQYEFYMKSFLELIPELDSCIPALRIPYKPSDLLPLINKEKVASGAGYSLSKTFMMGCGSGVKDDNIWYMSFTYTDKTDVSTMFINTLALVLATTCEEIGVDLGDDMEECIRNGEEIVNVLFEADADEDTAIQLGDVILFRVIRERSNQIIVGIDSAEYFDNSNNTITNFLEYPFES